MLRRIEPGETIGPQLWNALVERLHESRATSDIASVQAAPALSTAADLRPRGVEFRNDSGLTAPACGVLRVTGFSTADGHRALTIEQPNSTLARNYAVNSPVDVPAGQYGVCYLGGLVEVLYDAGTPAIGEGFGPQSGQWTATKNYPAAFSVLGIVDEAGQVMACQFETIDTVIGKLADLLAAGGSAPVDIWAGSSGLEAVVSDLSITAQDWLLAPGAFSIPAGTKVVCQWINGAWYVTALP